MKGNGINLSLWGLTCAVLGIGLLSCRPEPLPTSWAVHTEYIEGSPVDSAWIVLLEELQHSGNWQDGYTLEPVLDTIYTDAFGNAHIPIQGLEGLYHLHIGRSGNQTNTASLHYEGTWTLPAEAAASIQLPTPSWIRCIGGRKPCQSGEPYTVELWSPYDLGPSEQASCLSFTPGASPNPSLLIQTLIHPWEELPASRMWNAAMVSPSGQRDTLPSLILSIERHHLIDTLIVEQFW